MHSQQRHMSPTGMHHHQQMQNQRPNQPPVPRMGGMHPNPKQPQLPLMTLGGQKQPYYPQSPGAPPLRLQNRPLSTAPRKRAWPSTSSPTGNAATTTRLSTPTRSTTTD